MLLKETNAKLSKPDHLMDLISKSLRKYQFADVEYFLAITLDVAGMPIKIHDISKGTMNHTIISPQGCVQDRPLDNACSVWVV